MTYPYTVPTDDPTATPEPPRRARTATEAAAAEAAAAAAAAAVAAGADAATTIEAATRAAAQVTAGGDTGARDEDGAGTPRRRRATGPIRPQRPRPQERPPFAESLKLEREWWLRLPLILISPRAVFSALRDDRDEAAEARQEPMIALLFFAGLSIFFMSRTAGTLLDDPEFDSVVIALQAIVTVPITAIQNYWVGGLALALGVRFAGAKGTRTRQARHVIGLAQAPLIIALLTVFPVRLAVFGGDMFRSGGSDDGTPGLVFDALNLVFVAWAVVLLVIGVRAVWGWGWLGTARAIALALAMFGAVAALAILL